MVSELMSLNGLIYMYKKKTSKQINSHQQTMTMIATKNTVVNIKWWGFFVYFSVNIAPIEISAMTKKSNDNN